MKKKWRNKTDEEKIETIKKGAKWTFGGLAVIGVGYLLGWVNRYNQMEPFINQKEYERYLGILDEEDYTEEA